MALSREEVVQIANLARLDLSEEQIGNYQLQLSAILQYADKLNELDLDGVAETTHAVPSANVWRADQVEETLTTAEALENAAKHTDSEFIIQAVLDE